jgi:hypothetical protein
MSQWPSAAIGGEVAWDLRRPADFDSAARYVSKQALGGAVCITNSIARISEEIEKIAALGADAVHLHMVGHEQEAFIDAIGRCGVLGKRQQR